MVMLMSGDATTMTGPRAGPHIPQAYTLAAKAAERETLPCAHGGMSKAERTVR